MSLYFLICFNFTDLQCQWKMNGDLKSNQHKIQLGFYQEIQWGLWAWLLDCAV